MNEFPLTILDSYELYTGAKRINLVLTTDLSDDAYVRVMCSNLTAGISGMEKAMGKNLKSDFTDLLIEKDKRRDSAFLGLRNYINSQVHSSNSEKATAALKLASILNDIGNGIYRLGYADETAKLNTLITALKKADNSSLLKTILGEEWLNELNASQEEFERSYSTKIQAESEIDYPLLKESKKKVIQFLRTLLSYVESNTWINETKYKPVALKIDEITTDTLSIARNRITRMENEKKEQEVKK